jgi:hypothetical protein
MVSLAESLEESPHNSRMERGRSLMIRGLMNIPRKMLLRLRVAQRKRRVPSVSIVRIGET